MSTQSAYKGLTSETITERYYFTYGLYLRTRVTRSGRKLTYRLSVIQQPERARACGSGAKSSADRRPVDPPPVVELRIFEGEGKDSEDVTFSYAANFFLFATLEVARPMAHIRGQAPAPAPVVPVLTGMPVSGMAYLDRPTEAGYFIFPDLSVRHEGQYRLSFNLYEETKNPKEDGDLESPRDKKMPGEPENHDASFDWRLEVKSASFLVYSAKKFPGLAESTSLSRTVAEQGCRVRIRRDVRMRRREEGKTAGDFEEQQQQDEYARVGRNPEQDPYHERSRSNSATSVGHRGAPYPGDNRESYISPSPVGGQPAPHGGNLNFNDNFNQQQNQYPAPPQFVQPGQHSYPPPSNNFPPAPPQYRPAPQQPQPAYNYDRQYAQPAQSSPHQPYPQREHREFEQDYRRSSVATGYSPPLPLPPPQSTAFPAVDSRPQFNSGFRSPAPQLAPLKILETKYPGIPSPAGPPSSVGRSAPMLHSPTYDRIGSRSSISIPLVAAPIPAQLEPIRSGNKRPFDRSNAFDSSSASQPLYDGMRPNSSKEDDYQNDTEESDEPQALIYKRAGGELQSRAPACASG